MAPLRSVLEAQPHLNIRQNALPLRPITLTVTRATTTFTTTMNLGVATSVPTSQDLTVNATPTISPEPIVKISSGDPSNNTGVVIGSLIGGLVAAFLLIILLWKCCHNYRYVGDYRNRGNYYNSDSDASSFSSSTSSPSDYRRRSGAGFSRRNERGHRVEVPRPAYARRDKRSSHGSSSGSQSNSSWMRSSRRRGGWGDRVLDWVAGGTYIRRVRSRRGSVGSSGRRRRDPRFATDY